MADYKVSENDLISVADAIRTKGGTSASLSFPNGFVTAIGNIPTGGSSTLITKSITANGTYSASSDNADGYSEVMVNVPSRFVTGSFTPQSTEANSVKSVSVPYSGSGDPIVVAIFPKEGAYKSGTTIADTAQQKAIVTYLIVKDDMSTAPSYSGSDDKNKAYIASTYKNSNSTADSYTSGYQKNYQTYTSSNPTGSFYTYSVRFSDNKTMKVYVATTDVYGFLVGQEYTYIIMYSA